MPWDWPADGEALGQAFLPPSNFPGTKPLSRPEILPHLVATHLGAGLAPEAGRGFCTAPSPGAPPGLCGGALLRRPLQSLWNTTTFVFV